MARVVSRVATRVWRVPAVVVLVGVRIHISHMGCFENTGLPGVTMFNLRNIIGRDRFVSVKANKHC